MGPVQAKNIGLVFLLVLGSGACRRYVLPQPPSPSIATAVGQLGAGVELYELHGSRPHPHRQVIFVALDHLQYQFGLLLARIYAQTPPPRIEDIGWWEYAGQLAQVYDRAVRIDGDSVTIANLQSALAYAEALQDPYDLYLLTHGQEGVLATTPPAELLTADEIAAWRLPHLRGVFMQACESQSLVPAFTSAGARVVLSYPNLTTNYVYYRLLLDELADTPESIEAAYAATNRHFGRCLLRHPLYAAGLAAMGIDVLHYVDQVAPPVLWHQDTTTN